MTSYMNTYDDCLSAMQSTYQFENVTIYQHGVMVHEKYLELINILKGRTDNVYNLPKQLIDWFTNLDTNNNSNMLAIDDIRQYHYWHDCGKPSCISYDADGKKHFHNHALHSFNQYTLLFGESDISYLILHDMDFHVMKGDDISALWNTKHSSLLYLTAWAEILANCEMFGGIDSISYKIKRKHLIKALNKFNKQGNTNVK